jgi:molybdenum cofactor cytidylyltransferase
VIAAVILAAGRSSRMGRPKAFLPHRAASVSFLDHLVAATRSGGADPIYVVGQAGDAALAEAAARLGATSVGNPDADGGQLTSLLAGLEAADRPDLEGILVTPVDVPLVSAAVVSTLIAAARGTDASILRPACGGRHGHPVLFMRAVFDELRGADPTLGARAIVRADAARVLDVEVRDPGVLEDVDTPQDYLRVFGRRLD